MRCPTKRGITNRNNMHRKQFKISIITLLLTIAMVLLIGTILFTFLEGWSVVDAFYFVTMTATTVGYGDFIPTHNISKIVTIVYSLSIVPFVLYAFTIVAKFQTEHVYRKISGLEHKQHEQEEEIEKTERKMETQRRHIKDQEGELNKQETRIKKQIRLNREQEHELMEHEKELKGHQKKITKQAEVSEQQEKEIEVVEDIVEKKLVKKK